MNETLLCSWGTRGLLWCRARHVTGIQGERHDPMITHSERIKEGLTGAKVEREPCPWARERQPMWRAQRWEAALPSQGSLLPRASLCAHRCHRQDLTTSSSLARAGPRALHSECTALGHCSVYINWFICSCMHRLMGVQLVCGGQKTSCKSWFSPSTICVPRLNSGAQACVASPLPAEPSCQP